MYQKIFLIFFLFLFVSECSKKEEISLKPPNEYYSKPPQLLPINPTLYHYHEAFFPELIDIFSPSF